MPETKSEAGSGRKRRSSRNKHDEIIVVATKYFGTAGYEDTKWADVAESVGIGATALYHYFESKLHCLYEIMSDAVLSFREDFDGVRTEHDDLRDVLVTALRSQFDLSEDEILRNRVLVAEQGLIGIPRSSPREEEARLTARAHMRELEMTWSTFLARCMEAGLIPERNPQLMSRAVLGLYNSIWHWYRPRGLLSLQDLADFYIPCQLAMLGLEAEREG